MVVHREDQEKINLFAKKTSLFNDLQSQITAKEVRTGMKRGQNDEWLRCCGMFGVVQKELRNLDDASDELILVDDADFIPYPSQF